MRSRSLLALLVVGCGLGLLAPNTARANGSLLTRGGALRPLEVAYQHVDVRIDGRMARTTVTQVFLNTTDDELEATYVFPLPGDASVAGFATWHGGRRVEAELEEKEEARRAYDTAAARGGAPSLLEQLGPNRFQIDVFGVPARGSKRIELSYTEVLSYSAGTVAYSFPARFRKEVTREIGLMDVDLQVAANAPLTFVGSPSYPEMRIERPGSQAAVGRLTLRRQVPSQDVDLVFGSDAEATSLSGRFLRSEGDELGTFAVGFSFNRALHPEERPGRTFVLALDTSLSMAGGPLQRARELVGQLLERLGPEDRFEILPFSSQATPVFGQPRYPRPEHLFEARRALEGLQARGGSDLERALDSAAALFEGAPLPEDGEERAVVLLTDGSPTLGERSPDALAAVAPPEAYGASLVVVHLGYPSQSRLLRSLGSTPIYHYVPEGPAGWEAVEQVVTQLTSPALRDLQLRFDGLDVEQVHPSEPVTLFEGQQLLVTGRYRVPEDGGDVEATVEVVGRSDGAPLTLSFPLHVPRLGSDQGVGRLWARKRVEHLLARVDGLGEGDDKAPLVAEIVALARSHRLVTPYTSFLARRPDADLHPDRIKPGDPVITFQAPATARRVVALLPWGEEILCVYLEEEGRWMGRFLVPRGTEPGLYRIRIYVQLQDGAEHRYTLFYRVDQEAPRMRLELAHPGPYAAGAHVVLRAVPIEHVYEGKAVARKGGILVRERVDVKRLVVRVFGQTVAMRRLPLSARWEGEVVVPADARPGRHGATLLATDWAGNAHEDQIELQVAGGRLAEVIR